MKRQIQTFTLLALFFGATAACAAVFSLQKTRQTYNAELEKIDAGYVAARADWGERYGAGLKELEKRVQAEGELDKLLEVREEIRRFKDTRSLSGKPGEDLLKDIIELRKDFADSNTRSREAWAAGIMRLTNKYVQFLDKNKKRLTREGDIDAAILVNQEIQRVRTSDIFEEAQTIAAKEKSETGVAPTGTSGSPTDDGLSAKLKTIRVSSLYLDISNPSPMFEVLHRTLQSHGIELKSTASSLRVRHVRIRSDGSNPRSAIRVVGDRPNFQGYSKRTIPNVTALDALDEVSRTFAVGYRLEPNAVVLVDVGTPGAVWQAVETDFETLARAFKSNRQKAHAMYIGKEIHISGVYERSGKTISRGVYLVLDGGRIRAEFDKTLANSSSLNNARRLGDNTRSSLPLRGPTRLIDTRRATRQRLRVWCAGKLRSFGGGSLVLSGCRDVAWGYE